MSTSPAAPGGSPLRLRLKCGAGAPDTLLERVHAAALRVGGLQLVAEDRAARYDPILAIFDGDLAGAHDFLQRESDGLARIVLAAPSITEADDREVFRLFAAGAEEVIDLAPAEIDAQLCGVRERLERWSQVDATLTSSRVQSRLVGRSLVWVRALRALIQASLFGKQPILLRGETGTGKEAAARLIHELDPTRTGECVLVDCASVVETLSASELFGHRRGAFTGAERDREGAVARANGGTLFLDEIGELKPTLQVELLRVLQEGTYKPIGDDRLRQSEFRLVTATNRDLQAMVRDGAFRADLYYRIAAVTVHLPPLRERKSDLELLISHFLRDALVQAGNRSLPQLDARVTRLLQRLSFPGNVRELRSLVQGIAANCGATVRPSHLPAGLLAELATVPAGALDWEREMRGCVERAIAHGISLTDLLERTKNLACESALKLEGSARKAAQRMRVSTRMVEKRRFQSREPLAEERPVLRASRGLATRGAPD